MKINGGIKPKSGTYDTKHKAEHRQLQLDAIIRSTTEKVLILPSTEYLEVPILLSKGIKEENIYAVDRCFSILHSIESDKYPKVNKILGDVASALEKLGRLGIKLDAANIDLCGTWCKTGNDRLLRIKNSGAFNLGAKISITQSVGHISPEQIAKRDPRFKVHTINRALYAAHILNGGVISIGEYRNPGIGPTMQWAAMVLN